MDKLRIFTTPFNFLNDENDDINDLGDDFCHGIASFGQKDSPASLKDCGASFSLYQIGYGIIPTEKNRGLKSDSKALF